MVKPQISKSQESPVPVHMVGYETEMSSLLEILETHDCHGALIVGAAGVGKTAILNEALTRTSSSAPVLRFRGTQTLQAHSLGIFDALLASEGHSSDLGPAVSLPLIARAIEARSNGIRPTIIVDNGDLVDEDSLSVLAQLVEANRIRLVCAAIDLAPPLDLLSCLWTAGRLVRIDLAGIDECAVASLAEQFGIDTPHPQYIAELHSISHGSPQILNRILRGQLTLSAADHMFEQLDTHSREFIEIISIMGTMPVEALNALTDAASLEPIEQFLTVSTAPENYIAVALHEPMTSENIKRTVLPARSRQLFDLLATVVEPSALQGRALLGFASWAQTLGIQQDAETVCRAASWANFKAEYSAAIALINSSEHKEHKDLRLELCLALKGAGKYSEATALVEELIELSLDTVDSEVFVSKLASAEIALRSPRHPDTLKTEWVRERVVHPHERGRLEVTRARFEIRGGRYESGAAMARGVYRDYACLPSHRLRACALLGESEVLSGHVQRGLRYTEQAALTSAMPGIASREVEDIVPSLFIAYYSAGQWQKAKSIVRDTKASRLMRATTDIIIDARAGWLTQTTGSMRNFSTNRDDLEGLSSVARMAARFSAAVTETHRLRHHGNGDHDDSSEVSAWAAFESELFRCLRQGLLNPAKAAGSLFELGHRANDTGAHTLALHAWLEAACLAHHPAVDTLATVSAAVDGTFGKLGRATARALASGSPTELLKAARFACDLGFQTVSARLAKMVRNKAKDSHDRATVREARKIMNECSRAAAFGPHGPDLHAVLTALELQIVNGVADELSNVEIGTQLHFSPRTIDWYLTKIYSKLYVRNRHELKGLVRLWSSV